MSDSRAFTLIEVLIVIAIIGILSSIVLASLSGARVKARDTKRAAYMHEMQKALEMYYNEKGHYPITSCTSPDTNWVSFDSVTYASRKVCPTIGAAGVNTLTQEMAPYIPALIDDNPVNASDAGYMYLSETGTDYCFMSYKNPENLKDFAPNLINSARCGSGNTTAQCSAQGTSGGPSENSIYIGVGAFATGGC